MDTAEGEAEQTRSRGGYLGMTTLTDRTIGSLRRHHEALAATVPSLSDTELALRSGASDWSVAEVLSHLGSGAEIAAATLRHALGEGEQPDQEFNTGVWERWNALSARAQADSFLVADAELVDLFESLTPEQRAGLEVPLGFLPAPLPLETYAGMRLSEMSQHSWDVFVALDPAAALDAEAAEIQIDHFLGGLGFFLGFTGKADQLESPTVLAVAGSDLSLVIDDSVRLTREQAEPTATFTAPAESVVRLLSGRLKEPYVGEVEVSGALTLEDLRRVFPGY